MLTKKTITGLSVLFIAGCGPSANLSLDLTGYTCENGKTPAEILGKTTEGKINNLRPWKPETFCKMANNIVNEPKNIAAESLDSLCSNALSQAEKAGSVAILMKTLEAIAEVNGDADVSLKLLRVCTNEKKRANEIADIATKIKVELHSVGTFRVDGNICAAYLTKTVAMDKEGESIGYTLNGLGECAGMQTSNAITYHPAFNPYGPLPGEFFLRSLEYDGHIPDTWQYNGRTFKMFVR